MKVGLPFTEITMVNYLVSLISEIIEIGKIIQHGFMKTLTITMLYSTFRKVQVPAISLIECLLNIWDMTIVEKETMMIVNKMDISIKIGMKYIWIIIMKITCKTLIMKENGGTYHIPSIEIGKMAIICMEKISTDIIS